MREEFTLNDFFKWCFERALGFRITYYESDGRCDIEIHSVSAVEEYKEYDISIYGLKDFCNRWSEFREEI